MQAPFKKTAQYYQLLVAFTLGLGTLVYAFAQYLQQAQLSLLTPTAWATATVQHKAGELLLGIGYGWLLLSMFQVDSATLERRIRFVRPLMLAGGSLNLLAWTQLCPQVAWHPWCLVLAAWSVGYAPLLRWQYRREQARRQLAA